MRILKISWQMLAPREASFFFSFLLGARDLEEEMADVGS